MAAFSDDTVDIYRAVSPEEFDDIFSIRGLRTVPGGMEVNHSDSTPWETAQTLERQLVGTGTCVLKGEKPVLKITKSRVYFIPESEGNFQEGFDGMRPSFNLTGELVLSFVRSLDGLGRMPRGGTYDVEIELPYGEHTDIPDHLVAGARFKLQAGGLVIATGEVIEP